MGKKRRAMTLVEMVVCLAIIAICLVALSRAVSNTALFSMRQNEESLLLAQTETLIAHLEAQPPAEQTGTLEGDWRYRTVIEGEHYLLEVWHARDGERHTFVLREGA